MVPPPGRDGLEAARDDGRGGDGEAGDGGGGDLCQGPERAREAEGVGDERRGGPDDVGSVDEVAGRRGGGGGGGGGEGDGDGEERGRRRGRRRAAAPSGPDPAPRPSSPSPEPLRQARQQRREAVADDHHVRDARAAEIGREHEAQRERELAAERAADELAVGARLVALGELRDDVAGQGEGGQ